jgi:tRNA(Ile)-lysidine synthase TilS/MesJ
MRKILYQINKIFIHKLFLTDENNILCAVSGGQDSILLCILLLHFEKKYNYNLQILYCQHFWQRTNFAALWLIWKLAFLLKIPLYIILTEKSLITENRAREWRQESYQRITAFSRCNQLSIGHTASDRIETAFWNLIRGSSLKGLTSIEWEKKMQISSISHFFPSYTFLNCNSSESDFSSKLPFEDENQNIIISTTKTKQQVPYINRNLNKFDRKNSWSLLKKQAGFSEPTFNLSNYSNKWSDKNNVPSIGRKFNPFSISKKQNFFRQSSLKNLGFNSKFSSFYNNSFLFTIREKSEKKVIRPLLGLHRSDITKFIDSSKLPILNDSSNQKIKLQRNKIRYQLLPTIRYSFNRKVDSLLNQFLDISTDEFSWRKNASKSIFEVHSLKKISPLSLQRLPTTLQRDLIVSIFLKTQKIVLNYSQIEIIRLRLSGKKSL